MAKFFTYRQNNSFGWWNGPKFVIVEAENNSHADEIAQENGVYFDGVSNGQDCRCCGDRWNRSWEEGTDVPSIYGEPAESGTDLSGRPYVNGIDYKIVRRTN